MLDLKRLNVKYNQALLYLPRKLYEKASSMLIWEGRNGRLTSLAIFLDQALSRAGSLAGANVFEYFRVQPTWA